MIVKVCGMREPENIQQLLEEPAPDLMGLIFYPPSSRYVGKSKQDPLFYKELRVSKVGVFVDAEEEEVMEAAAAYGLEYIQLHGHESLGYIASLKKRLPLKYIKVFRVGETWNWDSAEPFLGLVDLFLFDTLTPGYGGSGETFGWEMLLDYPFSQPFLLSGGVKMSHVSEIKALKEKVPALMGVDINSKFEVAPGLKDIDSIKAFIDNLRVA